MRSLRGENKLILTGQRSCKFEEQQTIIQDNIFDHDHSKLFIPKKSYTMDVNIDLVINKAQILTKKNTLSVFFYVD